MGKKFLLLLSLVLLFSSQVHSASVRGGTEPPPELLGYLRVENPEEMIGALEGFLQDLELPSLAGMFLRNWLAGMIANPSLFGVNLSGPFILASFQPEQPDTWAVSIALHSPESYHRALIKSWKVKSKDRDTGITIYSQVIREFDSKAFIAASVEERVDVESFYRPREKTLAVAVREKRAWVTLVPGLLSELASLGPADFPGPVQGDLVIGLRILPLLEFVEAAAEEMMASPPVKTSGLAARASLFGPGAVRERHRAALDFYFHYVRQVENVFLGISLDNASVRMEKLVCPRSGTWLAQFLSAQKAGKLSLARLLEPSPWLAVTGRIEKPEMLREVCHRLSDVFVWREGKQSVAGEENGPVGESAEFLKSSLPLIEDYLSRVISDEMAFSISSSPESLISALSLQKIRSQESYREYIRKNFLSNRDFLEQLSAGSGIKSEDSGREKPEVSGGVKTYTFQKTFDFENLSNLQAIPEDQKQLLSLMESPLVIRMAAADELAVTATSWGGEPDLSAVLRRITTGESSFDTSHLGRSWSEANGVVYFSLNRFLKDFLEPMIEQGLLRTGKTWSMDEVAALGRLDLPLIVYLTVAGGNLTAAVEIPMEEIQAVKVVLESLERKKKIGKPGVK